MRAGRYWEEACACAGITKLSERHCCATAAQRIWSFAKIKAAWIADAGPDRLQTSFVQSIFPCARVCAMSSDDCCRLPLGFSGVALSRIGSRPVRSVSYGGWWANSSVQFRTYVQ